MCVCVCVCVVLGNEQLEGVSASVCATNRAITVAKDRAARAKLGCKSLWETLGRLVGEREGIRAQLEAVGRERERGERQREQYKKKMSLHRERVSQAEKSSHAHLELASLLTKKQQLEQESSI